MCPLELAPEFTLIPITPMRKNIGRTVATSFRDIPQFDVHVEVNASAMTAARKKYKEAGGAVVPGFNDMVMFSVSRLLEKHRCLNAHFSEEGIRQFNEINVGFATATPHGVLIPVVRKTNTKTIQEIAAETKEKGELAKAVKLRASFQMHGTFTVSSMGGLGIESFNGIISPPQVGILASGAIIKKPRVVDNEIKIVPVMKFTLTVDHRAIDGGDAAAFMADLKQALESFSE
jgi:pyruvate dehydrogenase E2 component (dihydrolipoamide acetyltransferase)